MSGAAKVFLIYAFLGLGLPIGFFIVFVIIDLFDTGGLRTYLGILEMLK